MGEGVAIGGGLAGSAMQGYQQARAQKTQERMQQVAAMDKHSDSLFNYMQAEKDPAMSEVYRQAFMKNNSERDALAGEKGPGAWKAVKHIFGFSDDKSGGAAGAKPPVGFSDKVDAAATPPPADTPVHPGSGESTQGATITAPQELQADPNAPPMGYSSPAEATTGMRQVSPGTVGGDIWQKAAAMPPTNKADAEQEAVSHLITIASHYKSEDEMNASPEFRAALPAIQANLRRLGMDPDKVMGSTISKMFADGAVVDPNSEMGNFLYKDLGWPQGKNVQFTALPGLFAAMPKMKAKMEDKMAELTMGVANGTIKKGSPEYDSFKFLQGIAHPDNSTTVPEMMMDAYIKKFGDTADTRMRMVKDYIKMQNSASGRDHYTAAVSQSDGFMWRTDMDTGIAERVTDANRVPIYFGLHNESLFKLVKEGDHYVQVVLPDVVARKVAAHKDAEILADINSMPQLVPDMGPTGKYATGAMKRNPRYDEAMAIYAAATGNAAPPKPATGDNAAPWQPPKPPGQ